MTGKEMTPAKAQRRKVTGQSPSSRANARDLREISPFGRNDNDSDLCVFAPLRERSPSDPLVQEAVCRT